MEKSMKDFNKLTIDYLLKNYIFLILKMKPDDNDGALLFHHLKQCSNDIDICNLISKLEGCFAFIYYQV
jgi:hypothetical protein